MSVEQYKPIYKISEVAKILKTSINDVYRLINSGDLPYIILGSKKIKGKDLETFINTFPLEEVSQNEEVK